MCGRFETKPSLQTLVSSLKKHNVDLIIELESEDKKSATIAPTNKIFSISYTDNNYKLSFSNWGIKFSADSPLIFNSRIETIKEKRYWMNLFDKNRLLVPMSAFYEWKKEGAKKIPYRFFLPDEDIFFVPALFVINKGKEISSSLITTTPNKFIRMIHHRMPVILKIKDGLNYLLDDADTNLTRCIPYTGRMEMEPAEI